MNLDFFCTVSLRNGSGLLSMINWCSLFIEFVLGSCHFLPFIMSNNLTIKMGHRLLQKMDKFNKYKLVRIYLVLCSMLYNVLTQWRCFSLSSGTLKMREINKSMNASLQLLCLQASWKFKCLYISFCFIFQFDEQFRIMPGYIGMEVESFR